MRMKFTNAIIYILTFCLALTFVFIHLINVCPNLRIWTWYVICVTTLAYCYALLLLLLLVFVINKTDHNVCHQLEENAKWSPLDICFILVKYFYFNLSILIILWTWFCTTTTHYRNVQQLSMLFFLPLPP